MVKISEDESVQAEISNIGGCLNACEDLKYLIIDCINNNDEEGDLYSYIDDMRNGAHNLSIVISRLEKRLDEIREIGEEA